MTLSRRRARPAAVVVMVLAVAGAARHVLFTWELPAYRPLTALWGLVFAFGAGLWVVSRGDRPWTVTTEQQARLDRLRVTVNVPLWNEDPAIVDRVLFALLAQTRPPQRIDVIDDGSDVDYTALRVHWERRWPCGTEVRWVRHDVNEGKKHAQAAGTFLTDPAADIIVTVDSDTALAADALAEGLKPFAHRRVQSVAGIELAMNAGVNWLTRTVSARSLFFQLVACGAQSVTGDVLVNRGAFALYRAQLLRDIVPAYLGETFFGMPVRLGDDAALTLFARGRGRAVQQTTAFAFTMYPEDLSHHLRQWIRWMRGSTIRNCWRVRYLPVWSLGWWFTVAGIYGFAASTLLPVDLIVSWPASAGFGGAALVAALAWSYVMALRVLAVHRSDETAVDRWVTWGCYPAAMLWSALVLRPLRWYGIATYRRQGWTTRQDGAEVGIEPEQVAA